MCLIFEHIFSGLDGDVHIQAPPAVMQFGDTLQRLLTRIYISYDAYGFVFLGKVYLRDTYMPVCIFLEVIPQLAFMVLPHLSDLEPMIGFNLLLHMGYM